MARINIRPILIIATLLSLVSTLFAFSVDSSTFKSLGYIFALPYYILFFIEAKSFVVIFAGLFGPIMAFISWLFIIYSLEYFYYTVIRKKIVVSDDDVSTNKDTVRTWIVLVCCITFVVIMNIFLFIKIGVFNT